jgi:hypothetical protein
MFKVLQVLQHHSDVLCTAGIATSQRCSIHCRSQHLVLQYCDIITMFKILQGITASTAVLQHNSHVQCTAGIAMSRRCSMYCSYCNITALFNVLQVLQHHSAVLCTAGIATSQRCSMYCRYCNITAMFYVL